MGENVIFEETDGTKETCKILKCFPLENSLCTKKRAEFSYQKDKGTIEIMWKARP